MDAVTQPPPPPPPTVRFDQSGRRVLVTGGTSGIGAAIAQAFRDAGADVLACAADAAEVARAQRDPAFRGIRGEVFDVTDDAAVQAVVGGLGPLDAVVCSAGIALREAEMAPEGFARVLDVNLTGSFRVVQAAMVAGLAQRRGSVVLLASMLSFFGSPRLPAYAASKGGIRSLTQSLAARYAPVGVRVNAVAPGWIETPLSETGRNQPAVHEAVVGRTPMARWGRPAEVAGPVLFLCSEAASFVTGAVLPVDGGYSAMG